MSVTRWTIVLLTAGVMAILAVYTQHAVSELSYERSRLQAEVKRLDEEICVLETGLETILTPEALAEHAAKFGHLVPPGRSR